VYTSVDERSVNTIRVLAADVVRKANSGHPVKDFTCKCH
jgi:transketolase